jgi:hypothetical protein
MTQNDDSVPCRSAWAEVLGDVLRLAMIGATPPMPVHGYPKETIGAPSRVGSSALEKSEMGPLCQNDKGPQPSLL